MTDTRLVISRNEAIQIKIYKLSASGRQRSRQLSKKWNVKYKILTVQKDKKVNNMTDRNRENLKFVWRITAAHCIAYFIAGVFAMNLFDYENLFSSGILSCLMKPTNSPIVVLGGTSLQIIRGIIIALVLLPMRKIFTVEKYGFLKLGLLILGLSVLSTFGPAFGSFEGFIYTKMSVMEQIIGYPEAILWISLFIGILWTFYKFEKRAINIIANVFLTLLVFMGVIAYLGALGIIFIQN
jgi:hypothetical protein